MQGMKSVFFVALVALLTSCGSTVKFPISSVTPAAEISAKMKQDDNKNKIIEVNAKNMASAERLNPPMKNYVVWILTDTDRNVNIGQLLNKNGKKSYLKTSTPFNVREIFITAEEKGDVTYPSGIEISRTTYKSK